MEVAVFQNSGDLTKGLVNGDCQAAIVPEHDVNARSDYQAHAAHAARAARSPKNKLKVPTKV